VIVTPPYSEGQPEGQPCFDLSKHDKQSYLFFLIDSPLLWKAIHKKGESLRKRQKNIFDEELENE